MQRTTHELNALAEKEASTPPDETLLKLKLARGLGITLLEQCISFLPNNYSANTYPKAHVGIYVSLSLLHSHVASRSKGLVQTVAFDTNHSSYYYANLLWAMAS